MGPCAHVVCCKLNWLTSTGNDHTTETLSVHVMTVENMPYFSVTLFI